MPNTIKALGQPLDVPLFPRQEPALSFGHRGRGDPSPQTGRLLT